MHAPDAFERMLPACNMPSVEHRASDHAAATASVVSTLCLCENTLPDCLACGAYQNTSLSHAAPAPFQPACLCLPHLPCPSEAGKLTWPPLTLPCLTQPRLTALPPHPRAPPPRLAAELPTAPFKNEGGPTFLVGPTYSVAADKAVATLGWNHDGGYFVIQGGAEGNNTVMRGEYSSWECVEGKPGESCCSSIPC